MSSSGDVTGNGTHTLRVAVCDEHGMFVEALAAVLVSRGRDVVAVTEHVEDIPGILLQDGPDVCVLGVGSRAASVMQAVTRIRAVRPTARILLLARDDVGPARDAYEALVVDGMINKVCDMDFLDTAITIVAEGGRVFSAARPTPEDSRSANAQLRFLTDREKEVLRLLADGSSTRAMAGLLGVSENTVRTHVQSVLRKLGVNRRVKAVRLAVECGLTTAAVVGS